MSAAIHVPAVVIAVPVYADDDKSQITGYWVAIVNLTDIESNLMQLDLGNDGSRILLIDDMELKLQILAGSCRTKQI